MNLYVEIYRHKKTSLMNVTAVNVKSRTYFFIQIYFVTVFLCQCMCLSNLQVYNVLAY